MTQKASTLGGTLLVAGTSIGGGMLALPILTGLGGFIPSMVIYLFCWLFMASTGLLFLEISLAMEENANILSMAGRTLGKAGKFAAWFLYLFLFYCLTLAYIVGCGDLFQQIFQGKIPEWSGSCLFLIIAGPLVYAGEKVVGRLNIFLMLGLGLSFLCFVGMGAHLVKTELLQYRNWPLSMLGLPISFTAFAYQGIIPTLVNYMHRDSRRIRLAILIGSFLPFLAYVVWQWLILGIVPPFGPGGLSEALANGQNAVQPLKKFIGTPLVYTVGQYFAFFALITSFFGVTLGLLDFLSDGLKVKKTSIGKLLLCLLIFIPPLIVSYTHPHLFLIALDYAGGYGCALLLGLMPICMVWAARYRMEMISHRYLPGGRIVLSLLVLFVLFELACQVKLTIDKF